MCIEPEVVMLLVLKGYVKKREEEIVALKADLRAVVRHVNHRPFDHDYIKDEKVCPICKALARPGVQAAMRASDDNKEKI